MSRNKEYEFSNLVCEICKEQVGNGLREIIICFVDVWVVSEMKGNFMNVEKFMIIFFEGKRMVYDVCIELVKKIYDCFEI